MFWLSGRNKNRPVTPIPTDPIVDQNKLRTHQAADAAKMNADRLNKVFKQNGITLNILRAAGGGHER